MNKITPIAVYRCLLKRFGPQGWWPTTKPGSRRPGYHGRPAEELTEREKFEICVGAILTQNTAWTNVEKALENLHAAGVLSPEKLVRMPVPQLASLIRPSGYFNQKADRLKVFSRYLCDNYHGKLSPIFKKTLPTAREELLSMKGIGPETADSMLLYAGGVCTFVVDAYTKRLGARLGWYAEQQYDWIQRFFQERLPSDVGLYNEYHALIVALGKDFCKPKPRCATCPLIEVCCHEK